MTKQSNKLNRRKILMSAAAACLLASNLTWASPDMGGHHGMAMEGHGSGKMSHGMAMHGHGPHNAADHFLKMATLLELTEDQNKQLTKLRDDYIEKNALAEEQLRAAQSDIAKVLHRDDVDLAAANTLLDKIGKLQSQLWRAFAQQLHDIKILLTADQKKALNEIKHKHHGKMDNSSDHREKHHGENPHGEMR